MGAQQIPTHKSLRTAAHKYVEYASGARELYDLSSDPHETENVYRSANASLKEDLRSRLAALKACSGQACRDADGGT